MARPTQQALPGAGGSSDPQATRVRGTLERIVFRNPETFFLVGRLKDEEDRIHTIVGRLPSVREGDWLSVEGRTERNASYGLQLRVKAFEASTPTTSIGIRRYLAAGFVKGVGGALADRIVDRFGADTLRILETEPDRLLEVEGIGCKRKERLVSAWNEHRESRRAMIFLRAHGLGAAQSARILHAYGDRVVDAVTENPYRLADDIWGIGFQTADRIGQSVGIAADAPARAEAAVLHLLRRAAEAGHACQERVRLVGDVTELLALNRTDHAEAAVERLRERRAAVEEEAPPLSTGPESDQETPGEPRSRLVWLRSLHAAEVGIAAGLGRLLRGPSALPSIHVERALEWVETRRGLRLAGSQRRAISMVLGAKVSVLTGGPGVGKTTTVGALLAILAAKRVKVKLAAPTGRAAKRLSQASGREATTIHRLLRWNPRKQTFDHGADHLLPECDVLILDEASMVDLSLMHSLVAALPSRTHLLIVGDSDQLPSVGAGSVLADIMRSNAVPVARLTEVHRQAAGSTIVRAAHAINQGQVPDLPPAWAPGDLHFVDAPDPTACARAVCDLVTRELPRRFGLDPIRDVQVLAPMHRGEAGIGALNTALAAALGPAAGPQIERQGMVFRPGAKVIQLRNDYDREVFNGDVGVVESVDPETRSLRVRLDGSREVSVSAAALDQLALAYAISIHKSQGSEYPCVVIPLTTQHYVMLRRRLVYTAITRARRRVVLVGQRRALAIALRSGEEDERLSCLAARVRAALRQRRRGPPRADT